MPRLFLPRATAARPATFSPAVFPTLLAAMTAALVAGCGAKESIDHYRVPKPELVYAANHVSTAARSDRPLAAAAAPTDRMLGAIVPHASQTWYFKMTGPTDAVARQRDAFRQLIESVRFAGDAEPPHWQLPPSWTEQPGTGPRLATLLVDVDGQMLEVSVMQLATSTSSSSLLDNINRWRKQMQLAPITAEQLPQETTALELPSGQATLVELLGNFQSGGMGNGALGGRDAPPSQPSSPQEQ
jgi:hypothetical protein